MTLKNSIAATDKKNQNVVTKNINALSYINKEKFDRFRDSFNLFINYILEYLHNQLIQSTF